jgi:glycosyltransferase involved in cell wall biosynthesis
MDLSIIVPLFNEAESIPELFRWISKVMAENRFSFELIFIDDGSTDDSWKIIEKIKADNPEIVKGIKFRRNYGKSPALFCGFEMAQGDIVVTMDADLQDSPYFYIALTGMILGTLMFLAGFVAEMISRSSHNRNDYNIEKELK